MDGLPSVNWLNGFIYSHTNKFEPDGRPLYAYKCLGEEYDQIKIKIQNLFQTDSTRWTSRHKALFCLFSAETWRRNHVGGTWKWETVFRAINEDVPLYNWIYNTIEEGLDWWKRPLLSSNNGHREFLITIACEGGLPLRLLQQANIHLHRYFRCLLNRYHQIGELSASHGIEIARSLAGHLPRSLHHEIVFTLSAQLIQDIISLQSRVADAIDPISTLDKQHPNWRHELPLPVEDDTIEPLLKNLVTEARNLAITSRQKIRWRMFLFEKNHEWNIEQHLELPDIFIGATLIKWTGQQQLPARLRLLIHHPNGMEPVALITRLRGEEKDAIYRCEVLPRNGVRLVGDSAFSPAFLSLHVGSIEYPLPELRSLELGPLPWSFRFGNEQAEFLGEGSVRSRDEKMYVIPPVGGEFYGAGKTKKINDISQISQRDIYLINGVSEWSHPEFGLCRFQCASSDDSQDFFSLEGRRLPGASEDDPPILGFPDLFVTNQDGNRRRMEGGNLQWRPYSTIDTRWRPPHSDCVGDVWVRYTDSSGSQRLQRKLRVVPSSARIEIIRIGGGEGGSGTIRLTGWNAIQLHAVQFPGCRFSIRPMPDGAEIDCYAESGISITQFQVTVMWKSGQLLSFYLPFPCQSAAFTRGGQPLPAGKRLALSYLAATRIVVQAPMGSHRYLLSAKVHSAVPSSSNLYFDESIILNSAGRGCYDLHQVQEKISSLLALTGKLDDTTELKVSGPGDQILARIEVGLFDLCLEPDYAENLILMPPTALNRLDSDWENKVTVRMIRLWKPSEESIPLERCEERDGWIIPCDLEPGPWLVLGEDGNWPRFRPLLWNIAGELEVNNSEMQQAILQGDRLMRFNLMHDLIEHLASQPNHPDWPLFWEHLNLTRRYPARTFDFFEKLSGAPDALVAALIRSTDEDFDAVWSLAYQLPFAWHLIPIDSWRQAGLGYFDSLRSLLADIDLEGNILWTTFQDFRARVTNRQPFFRQICDWLAISLFPDRKLENSELSLGINAPQIISQWIADEEQKLQTRHDIDERYPIGTQVIEYRHRSDFPYEYRFKQRAKPFRSVLSAPFVAAHIALNGTQYNESFLFELQRLRYFDKEWFDASFGFALCLGLAKKSIG